MERRDVESSDEGEGEREGGKEEEGRGELCGSKRKGKREEARMWKEAKRKGE